MSEHEQGKGKNGESEENKPELRKITKEELAEILAAHEKWVEERMNPDKPGRADLSQTDLQGAHLYSANLQGADLSSVNLEGANLSRANLQGTKLYSANLQGAHLYSANLQVADLSSAKLQGADLSSAKLQVANLSSANLRGANLSSANLRGANLEGAYLSFANLEGASLVGAEIKEASFLLADLRLADATSLNFSGKDLSGTKLRGAKLQYVNLQGVRNLVPHELGGTDLYMAKLPEELTKFDGLDSVKEAAQKASHLFTILLLCCLYAWLTMGFGVIMAKDGALSLPFNTNAAINEKGFCLLAPAFLLGLFLYFQIYLQRLWDSLALLPAVFTDGTPLDKKAHPWLPIGYVRAHVPRLRENRPPFSRLQTLLIRLVVYWAVPASVGLFWWRSQGGLSWGMKAYQAILIWLACLIAEAFIYEARRTLRGEGWDFAKGVIAKLKHLKLIRYRKPFLMLFRSPIWMMVRIGFYTWFLLWDVWTKRGMLISPPGITWWWV